MNVPYNTGKVSIGKYYQKPYYVEQDDDMLFIQSCLLGNAREARIRYWSNFAYGCLVVVVFAAMAFA
jgi:hypothetical protein